MTTGVPRQSSDVKKIHVKNWGYYATKEALVKDEELIAMAQHYFIRYEAAAATSFSRLRRPWIQTIEAKASVEEAYESLDATTWMTFFCVKTTLSLKETNMSLSN